MSTWMKLRVFSTRLEAELARARLESADIPATITSHDAGMFGAGFQGFVPGGVELQVPSDALDAAAEILADATAET